MHPVRTNKGLRTPYTPGELAEITSMLEALGVEPAEFSPAGAARLRAALRCRGLFVNITTGLSGLLPVEPDTVSVTIAFLHNPYPNSTPPDLMYGAEYYTPEEAYWAEIVATFDATLVAFNHGLIPAELANFDPANLRPGHSTKSS